MRISSATRRMGKFDRILLATDWDGTFYRGKVFEENIRALKYFEENGGKFTVCSGRNFDFIKAFKDTVPINTYVSCFNGAYIADFECGKVLYQGFCDSHLFDIIDNIIDSELRFTEINIFDDKCDKPFILCFDEYKKIKDSFRNNNIYKILLRMENSDIGFYNAKEVNKMELYDYLAVRSWETGLELFRISNSKGAAIKRIAEAAGCKLVVAVGDYENDIDMIKAADIGYAVENAVDALKSVADRHTVSVTESAIAKIIYDIERDVDNNLI